MFLSLFDIFIDREAQMLSASFLGVYSAHHLRPIGDCLLCVERTLFIYLIMIPYLFAGHALTYDFRLSVNEDCRFLARLVDTPGLEGPHDQPRSD